MTVRSVKMLFTSSSSFATWSPKSRKTGRICGNCVLPRQEWRYDQASGRNFQRQLGKRVGIDMGLEDRILLSSLSQRNRRLDGKKIRQLSNILSTKIIEAASSSEILSSRAVQFGQVKVNNSFTEVTISWVCDGKTDDETAVILEKERHSLRRALSDAVSATCPEIRFIPDRTNLMVEEMDRLFKKADYGVDYRTLSNTARVMAAVDLAPKNATLVKPAPRWKLNLQHKLSGQES